MKRQISTQGNMLPKQYGPTHPFSVSAQAVPSSNHINPYLYDSNQAYTPLHGQFAQQPADNPYYYNNNYTDYYNRNYGYGNNTNNNSVNSQNSNLLQQNNMTKGWNNPKQYPPTQSTPAAIICGQFAPSQIVSPELATSTPFTSAQFAQSQLSPTPPTDFNTNPNVALGANGREEDIPLFYCTHPSNLAPQVGFSVQNSWNMGTRYNPPPLLNRPAVYEQPPKPRRPSSRRGSGYKHERNNEHIDLVDLLKSNRIPSPVSPVVIVTLAPVDQLTEPPQEPNVEQSQGDSAEPYSGPGADTPIEAGMRILQQHVRDLERQEAEAKRAQEEKKREEEKKQAEASRWPGDSSGYPAECFANMRLPGCEFRAHAIYVGSPRPELPRDQYRVPEIGRLVVYAVRRGSDGVEFKLAVPHSTPEEVMEASGIQFNDISLNANFSDMDELKVIRWSRYLLDAVPGKNDSVTMWSH